MLVMHGGHLIRDKFGKTLVELSDHTLIGAKNYSSRGGLTIQTLVSLRGITDNRFECRP